MPRCKNFVSQWVHAGWQTKEIKSKCGTTGVNGERLMCQECENEFKEQYPQGWRNTPGDICPHGNYVGDAYGPDYLCGKCESE
ncbi:MAG: hypothetical protein P9L97_05810 [Candidatus Tenebribacter davisii]|nr:hypothetical protein [Candidatus Tenebribacter davisii]